MGNNHKSELEAVTALLVKYRDERNAYYAKTQKEIERLERELASEVSRHVETDKSYKHWRDKANHLSAERDELLNKNGPAPTGPQNTRPMKYGDSDVIKERDMWVIKFHEVCNELDELRAQCERLAGRY